MPRRILLALLMALPAAGHALCTSDGTAAPSAVLERFISADCAHCWTDPATPRPGAGTLALDWVVPGTRGDDAPLSAAATPDTRERLAVLRRRAPAGAEAVTSRRRGPDVPLRLAQGAAFNDYVAASIALAAPGQEGWQAWLLLVEHLPAGTEGSPVERHLVRNAFRPDWAQGGRPGPLVETRTMQIRPGAQAQRLRLVALLLDARGRMRAIRRTECR